MTDTTPFKGIDSLESMFENMDDKRISRALLHREVKVVAGLFGVSLPRRYQTEVQMITSIREFLARHLSPPEDEPPECTEANCGGFSKLPEGLRWDKINNGTNATWSIDRTNQPNVYAFTDKEIQGWFDAWTQHGGLPVKKVEGVGDCHIQFRAIDGPGKTLGFVLQPRSPIEEMAAAGRLSGDMTIDSTERLWPLIRTRLVGKHEVGHFFGLGHSENPDDLLYFQLNKNTDIGPQPGDILEYIKRYTGAPA